jgi:F0F1-type ATP synthase assembly protein I
MINKKLQINNKFWQPQLQLVAKLSSWVAFPVIIGAFLGKWLDKKYDSEPWLFLITVGFSFLISMFGLIFNTIKEYKKIAKDSLHNSEEKKEGKEKENKENKKEKEEEIK